MDIYENPMYDDFTGFTFNSRHSSEFGLLRVSKSDRYGDTLVPTLSNETADIPGGNGKYYYGETRGERKFEINFAYDSLEEKDKRRIRRWLHPDDQLHELIFDERPFVKYWVKCEKEVTVDELCFNEGGKRIYKGDGTIPFVSYFTYGFVVDKDLASYEDWENFDEWSEASGLLKFSGDNDEENIYDENDFHSLTIKESSGHKLGCSVYNSGDAESGFVMQWIKDMGADKLTYFSTTSGQVGYIATTDTTPQENITYSIQKEGENPWKSLNISDINNVAVEASSETGYLQTDGTNPMVFVSNLTGELYTVYIAANTVSTYTYKSTNAVDFYADSNLYCIGNNNAVYLVNIKTIEGISAPDITLQFLDSKITNPPEELYIPFSSNCEYNIKITDPQNNTLKELSILLPGGATTNPKYWSEAQKAYFYGGDIKIDTNKKIVSFKSDNDNNDNWVGIMGVVNGGTLFKIPIDELESNKQDFNQISIEVDSNLASQLSDASIDYNYLYI